MAQSQKGTTPSDPKAAAAEIAKAAAMGAASGTYASGVFVNIETYL